MKNRFYISALLCCVSLFGACSEDDLKSGAELSEGTVNIQFTLPSVSKADGEVSGTDVENAIGVTQIILVEYQANYTGLVERVITIDPKNPIVDSKTVWNKSTNTLSLRGVDTETAKCVYVIANATAINGFDVSAAKEGVTTEEDLRDSFTESTGELIIPTKENGLLMSGIKRNHDFKATPTVAIDLTRQMVKIDLTIKIDAGIFEHLSFDQAEYNYQGEFINLYNSPSYSYVNGTTPASIPFTDTDDFTSLPLTKSGSGADVEWKCVLYAQENPMMGKDQNAYAESTSFIVRLPCYDKRKKEFTTENYYKIHIINKNDSQNPHKTERNHIYTVTASLSGLGGLTLDDGRTAEVSLTVNKWQVVNLPVADSGDDLSKYTFLSLYRGYDYVFNKEDSTHSFIIGNSDAHQMLVRLTDNRGEMSVKMFDSNYKLLSGSGWTSKVTDGKEVMREVSLNWPSDQAPNMQVYSDYIFEVSHWMNGKDVPIQRSKFRNYNGIILTSVLLQYPGIEKWPKETFPEYGLQVTGYCNSIPGNPVIPTADEDKISWLSAGKGDVVTSSGLGTGKENTDRLIAASRPGHQYLAAQKCRSLGPEWYLPSNDELALLFKMASPYFSKTIHEFDYTETSYCSSTGGDSEVRTQHPILLRRSQLFYHQDKADNSFLTFSVRCVRNLPVTPAAK